MTLEQDAENIAAAQLALEQAIAKAEQDAKDALVEREAPAAEKVPTYAEYQAGQQVNAPGSDEVDVVPYASGPRV